MEILRLHANDDPADGGLAMRRAGFIGLPFPSASRWCLRTLARFGVDDKRGILIILELSQEDLAEMIGSSRPMVIKPVGDMVEEGLLARSEQHQYILLSPAERQSKLASSEVTRFDRSVSTSKSPASMAVGLSNPAGRDQSRVALSAMNHSSGRHNV